MSSSIIRPRPRAIAALLGCGVLTALAGCGGGPRAEKARLAPIACASAIQIDSGVDCVMRQFMAESGVTAATVTVMQNGRPLLDRGYGYQDAAKTVPLPANAMMLTASIVKPVTAAAIQKLAAAGTLRLSDRAFCNGRNAPCWLSADLSGPATDARAGDITILQLLTMTSGFDPAASGDQILQEAAIQKSLGISTPPQRTDIIRYRLARPLDTAPGAKYAYANFNYLVLGQIIEQASGRPYVAYVNSAIFEKLGVASTDFVGAASLVKDHGPREPNYLCSEKGASVYAPGNTVALNDGYIRADNWVSAGFSVTTSKAMALFGANYQIWGDTSAESPSARTGTALTAPLDQFAAGAWCGTESLLGQRKSGVSYAVLINKSSPASDSNYAGTLKAALDKVLNELRL